MDDEQHYRYYTVIRDGRSFYSHRVPCRCSRVFNHWVEDWTEVKNDVQIPATQEKEDTTAREGVPLLH